MVFIYVFTYFLARIANCEPLHFGIFRFWIQIDVAKKDIKCLLWSLTMVKLKWKFNVIFHDKRDHVIIYHFAVVYSVINFGLRKSQKIGHSLSHIFCVIMLLTTVEVHLHKKRGHRVPSSNSIAGLLNWIWEMVWFLMMTMMMKRFIIYWLISDSCILQLRWHYQIL